MARKRDSKGRFVKSGSRARSTAKRRTTRRRRSNPAKLAGVPISSGLKSGAAFAGAVYLAAAFTNLVRTYILDKIPVAYQGFGMLTAAIITGIGGMSLQRKHPGMPVSLFAWGLSAPLFSGGLSALGLLPSTVVAAPVTTTVVDNTTVESSGTYAPRRKMIAGTYHKGAMAGMFERSRSQFGNQLYGMRATM